MTVKFEDLEAITFDNVKTLDINGQTIEVIQYLPVDKKLELIGRVVNLAHDADYNFANPLKMQVYLELLMIMEYTNIEFLVDETNELINAPITYDRLVQSGILSRLLEAIPYEERHAIEKYSRRTIHSIYDYQNSALGIVTNIANNKTNFTDEINDLYAKLADDENVAFVKEVMAKLV